MFEGRAHSERMCDRLIFAQCVNAAVAAPAAVAMYALGCAVTSSYVCAQMWGKYAESKAKSQVTESLYETKAARTQQTTELSQVLS